MTTTPDCPEPFIALAQRLADAARPVVRRHFRTPLEIEAKADESPVTAADREAERVMRELIEEAYPDHAIEGEEFGLKQTGSDWCWHLDPIDGTKSFAAGSFGFGIMVGLSCAGRPMLGLIDQPITEERWFAHGKQATTLNGVPCRTRQGVALEQAIMHTSGLGYFDAGKRARFEALEEACWFTRMSLDCYAYGLIAIGSVHMSLEAAMSPHDAAALIPIVENAGGVVSDWSGAPIRLDRDIDSLIASADGALHEQAIKILSG